MITFDELRQLIIEDRTVRRFDENRKIEDNHLRSLIELTRYCHSGRNAQPLKYLLVNSEEYCQKIYPLLKWAGYFKDWDGPEPGERPSAYIIQCLDSHYGKDCLCDDGLQLEAISLGMKTFGLSGCIIKAFNQPALKEVLSIDERYIPRYVFALGYPLETVVIEDMDGNENADFKYFRTPDGVHHVPKRRLNELIIGML
ncbi:MAG: nitroreductase family protein [Muribaculaceae bacterium]|nr:nitroreductase family protein [Muribaculaceae bacterium]